MQKIYSMHVHVFLKYQHNQIQRWKQITVIYNETEYQQPPFFILKT